MLTDKHPSISPGAACPADAVATMLVIRILFIGAVTAAGRIHWPGVDRDMILDWTLRFLA
jgi:hypothetical protein